MIINYSSRLLRAAAQYVCTEAVTTVDGSLTEPKQLARGTQDCFSLTEFLSSPSFSNSAGLNFGRYLMHNDK